MGTEWTYEQVSDWIIAAFAEGSGNLLQERADAAAGLSLLEMLADPNEDEPSNVFHWLNAERTRRQGAAESARRASVRAEQEGRGNE